MVDMAAAEDMAVEIIVVVDELEVEVEECHPMLDGVMVDNIIEIVINFFVLTVKDINILMNIVGTRMVCLEMYLRTGRGGTP